MRLCLVQVFNMFVAFLNFSHPLIIVTMKAVFAVTFTAVAQAGEANHIEKIIQTIDVETKRSSERARQPRQCTRSSLSGAWTPPRISCSRSRLARVMSQTSQVHLMQHLCSSWRHTQSLPWQSTTVPVKSQAGCCISSDVVFALAPPARS